MSIIDRYVIRQVLRPLLSALLVFTFMLIIPFLIEYAEELHRQGRAALSSWPRRWLTLRAVRRWR